MLSALLIDVAILAATGLVVWITFGLLGPTWGIGYLMVLGFVLWIAVWFAVRFYIRRRSGPGDIGLTQTADIGR